MNPSDSRICANIIREYSRIKFNANKIAAVVCPPFIYLSELKKTNLKFGAQNCFWENPPAGGGAYTGEISPLMLKNLGCDYVIIGHSERRRYLQETDEMINKKLKAVAAAGLMPILCVGETLEQRKIGAAKQIVAKQLKGALKQLSTFNFQLPTLIVAYEPVWAIGTGMPCKVVDAAEMIKFIKKILNSKFQILNSIVLYGGSVDSKNIKSFLEKKEIDGALVGGASIKDSGREFTKMIKIINNISRGSILEPNA